MDFLKRMGRMFSSSGSKDQVEYWLYVRCVRCGENLKVRINMRNDLSIEYSEGGGKPTYFTRKVVIGEQRCYQPIEVKLTFDEHRKLIDRQISGGTFVEEGEAAA
jgi:hypothetical protein